MRSLVLALGIGAVCGAAYTGCGLTTEGELANAGPVGSSSSAGAGRGMTDAGPSCSTPAVLPDDTDLVQDNDPCKVEMCMAGVKQVRPAPDGTAGGTTGKLACINGLCEGCNQDPNNCDPADECHTVECQVNTCIVVHRTRNAGSILVVPRPRCA